MGSNLSCCFYSKRVLFLFCLFLVILNPACSPKTRKKIVDHALPSVTQVTPPGVEDHEHHLAFHDTYAAGYYLQASGAVTVSGTCSPTVTELKSQNNLPFTDKDCLDGRWSLAPIPVSDLGQHIRITATFSSGEEESISTYVGSKMIIGFDQDPNNHPVLRHAVIGAPFLATNSSKLFAVDSVNNRILVWNQVPTKSQTLPDYILGQAQEHLNTGGSSRHHLNLPTGIFATDQVLIVADTHNHRVLVWSPIPEQTGVPPDLVLGQEDFDAHSINRGASVSAASLSNPRGVWSNDNILYVADAGNHRVLVWNNFSDLIATKDHGAAATGVIGQLDFVSNTAGQGDLKFNWPSAIHYDGTLGKLFIADTSNNRIMVYNAVTPPTSQVAADIFIGQANANNWAANQGGLSSRSLYVPYGLATWNQKLLVFDSGNRRVLSYDALNIATHMDAEVVIGQDNFISNGENKGNPEMPSASSIRVGHSLAIFGNKLIIGDANARILMFDALPTVNGASADHFLMTSSFNSMVSSLANTSSTYYANNGAAAVLYLGDDKLVVCDGSGNRLLLYDLKVSVNEAIDVFGQDSLTSMAVRGEGDLRQRIGRCGYMAVHQGRLFAIDIAFNRLLIWNSLPEDSFDLPDIVIGQGDFQSTAPGLSASRFNRPQGVAIIQNKLVISDNGNNRILIWDSIPQVSGAPANKVLCQPDFDSNSGGVAANRCHGIKDIFFSDGQFIAMDQNNHRVLIWNGLPQNTQQPADYVIGQISFTSNISGRSSRKMSLPAERSWATDGALYVSDIANRRVLRYSLPFTVDVDSIIDENGIPEAEEVYMQPDFLSSYSNFLGGTTDPEAPNNIFYIDTERGYEWYINRNYRVIVRALPQ